MECRFTEAKWLRRLFTFNRIIFSSLYSVIYKCIIYVVLCPQNVCSIPNKASATFLNAKFVLNYEIEFCFSRDLSHYFLSSNQYPSLVLCELYQNEMRQQEVLRQWTSTQDRHYLKGNVVHAMLAVFLRLRQSEQKFNLHYISRSVNATLRVVDHCLVILARTSITEL